MDAQKPPIPYSANFKNRKGLKVKCERVESCVIVRNFFLNNQVAQKVFENTLNKFMRSGWELTAINGREMHMGKILVAKGLDQALSPKVKEKHSNIKLPSEGS